EPTLDRIRALGRPEILVVPQHLHAMDAHAFRERLGVKVFAPAAGRARVEERVRVEGTLEEVPADPDVEVRTVAGFRTGEGFLVVRSGPRTSLVVADVVLNVPDGPGVDGLVFRLLGMTGPEPRLPLMVRLRVLGDKEALRAQLGELARLPGLARIVTSHGANVSRDPAGVLCRIAAGL
ncbi:MAG TPA: hypothetical protein VFM45_04865, partial [Anaeromyxobacteraceae bacterium]|nr:hypothetical protein [Anaeromyxobacteraceae bacterium]